MDLSLFHISMLFNDLTNGNDYENNCIDRYLFFKMKKLHERRCISLVTYPVPLALNFLYKNLFLVVSKYFFLHVVKKYS